MVVRRAPSLFIALSLTLAACGDDGSPGKQAADTVQGTDTATTNTGTSNPDATTTTSAPDTSNPGGYDHVGFTAASSSYDGEPSYAVYQAVSSETEPLDVLNIELYLSGFAGAADGPGTYSLDGSNYETCANCVLIRTGCTADAPCTKTFYADTGDLVIDQWDIAGGRFKGSLEGLVLLEVTIDSESYRSTPVTGGETWFIESYPFDAEIKTLPVSDKTQAECVAEGTGNLLHDNIENLTLKNCLGEDVQLHATCGGESEALWLIGTTGWCVACHEFLEAFRLKHSATEDLTRAAIAAKTPGLDMLIILAENNDGLEPTEAFCKAYAEDMKIDPRMVVLDWSSREVEIPLIDPEGYSIPTQALGNTWAAINPYLQADSQGSVTTAYPWWAILRAPNMEYLWSDGGAIITFDQALEETLGRFPDELFE